MAYYVLYRRRAERDLERLAEGSTPKWFDGLANAIESLAEIPYRCAFATEPGLRQKRVRQLFYGAGRSIYRVLYRVKDENVHILTIRHARRRKRPIARLVPIRPPAGYPDFAAVQREIFGPRKGKMASGAELAALNRGDR